MFIKVSTSPGRTLTKWSIRRLVCQFCADELAVQAGDVRDGLALRADGFASTCVGAVAEAQFVHLRYHSLRTLRCLYPTLRKQGELAHLRADEEHCRAVLAGCHTSGATIGSNGACHHSNAIIVNGTLWNTISSKSTTPQT